VRRQTTGAAAAAGKSKKKHTGAFAMMGYVKVKQDAIEKQIDALGCDLFRITLKSRSDGLRDQNFGNKFSTVASRKKSGQQEKLWTKAELMSEKIIDQLTIKNMQGYEIYITPISDTHHFIVVDDLTTEKLAAFLLSGYEPCMTQKSSAGNVQAILKVVKAEISKNEQSIANRVVIDINKRFGDAELEGVAHPFRTAGYCNKKEGKDDHPTIILTVSPNHICKKTSEQLTEMRRVFAVPVRARAAAGGLSPSGSPAESIISEAKIIQAENPMADNFFVTQFANRKRDAESRGWAIDLDKIDFRVAESMLKAGFSLEDTTAALLKNSPHVAKRHKHFERYTLVTVTNANSKRG
jgi:hypothetical protein